MHLFTILLAAAAHAKIMGPKLAAIPGCQQVGSDVYDCGRSSDAVQISRVTMSPARPRKGDLVEIRIAGRQYEPVGFGASVYVTAKKGGRQLLEKESDFCQLALEGGGDRCPLRGPNFDFKYLFRVPVLVPKGRYEIEAVATSQARKQIFDIVFQVDLK